jgi:hypothetical protein
MVSTKELENRYSQYTDKEIIELASDKNVLTNEAITILESELKKRNLNIQTSDSKNTFFDFEKSSYILERFPNALRIYPHRKNFIRNISYAIIGVGIVLFNTFFSPNEFNFYNIIEILIVLLKTVLPLLVIYVGVKIIKRKDKLVQLIIMENSILFKQQVNFGKYKFQDFYSIFFSDQYNQINFDQIEDIIIPTDIFRVGSLYFLTYNGDKVYVLNKFNKQELSVVVADLKKRIGLKN